MSLIISFCSLAIFLILPFSFVTSTRTLQELENHRNVVESRRNLGYLSINGATNPIDSCWMNDFHWKKSRRNYANCALGFGRGTVGGKNGMYYVVNTTDDDALNPVPGMLRYGVIQYKPLWIVFKNKTMVFNLQQELIFNSYKTIDGRGMNVSFLGPACFVLQSVEHVIISNVYISNCKPTGGDGIMVRSTPDHFGYRHTTDGDAISIWAANYVWIDHVELSRSADGLIDAVEGSKHITISNSFLRDHNEAMLFGHDDGYAGDKGLQATFIYNVFQNLNQRIPRCREGNFEVVNNVYINWGIYAVGGSENATIKSQGNSYTASANPFAKEVTKRMNAKGDEWQKWNWISENDIMRNGAFFVPSGAVEVSSGAYAKATSLDAENANDVYYLTNNSGLLSCHNNLIC